MVISIVNVLCAIFCREGSSNTVEYDLLAFSRPNQWLTRIGVKSICTQAAKTFWDGFTSANGEGCVVMLNFNVCQLESDRLLFFQRDIDTNI